MPAGTAVLCEEHTTMFRLIRADELAALRADHTELAQLRGELAATRNAAKVATDSVIRAEITIEGLMKALACATADAAREEGELEAMRTQHHLTTEDRATLRMLLKIARKQSRPADRVFVLFRHGELHSLHATQESAELAAEAEGAPRSGWTAEAPGAALPPACEVAWRVQQLPLGGAC